MSANSLRFAQRLGDGAGEEGVEESVPGDVGADLHVAEDHGDRNEATEVHGGKKSTSGGRMSGHRKIHHYLPAPPLVVACGKLVREGDGLALQKDDEIGMLLDGTKEAESNIQNMLFYDVTNGLARRSWARNEGAEFAIKREMERASNLKVTLPNLADDDLIDSLF